MQKTLQNERRERQVQGNMNRCRKRMRMVWLWSKNPEELLGEGVTCGLVRPAYFSLRNVLPQFKCFFVFFFSLFLLVLHPQQMEVPRLEVDLELQLRPMPQPQQCRI